MRDGSVIIQDWLFIAVIAGLGLAVIQFLWIVAELAGALFYEED